MSEINPIEEKLNELEDELETDDIAIYKVLKSNSFELLAYFIYRLGISKEEIEVAREEESLNEEGLTMEILQSQLTILEEIAKRNEDASTVREGVLTILGNYMLEDPLSVQEIFDKYNENPAVIYAEEIKEDIERVKELSIDDLRNELGEMISLPGNEPVLETMLEILSYGLNRDPEQDANEQEQVKNINNASFRYFKTNNIITDYFNREEVGKSESELTKFVLEAMIKSLEFNVREKDDGGTSTEVPTELVEEVNK